MIIASGARPRTLRPLMSPLFTIVLLALLVVDGGVAAQAPASAFVRFGENVWLDRSHTTGNIRALDTKTEWVFLETSHFRLACSLSPGKLPVDSEGRRRLDAELAELRRRGVEFTRPGKTIDPKTRALLYALRLDRLYEDIRRRLGVVDSDFAIHTEARRPTEYLGEGPHLGMPHPYLVMLCARESTLQRYSQTFAQRRDAAAGIRHAFRNPACLFYGIAEDSVDGRFAEDSYLHAALTYSVTHNLIDGFRHYWHETPFWLQEGLAHWYRRQVIEEFDHYTALPIGLPERNKTSNWSGTIRARVELGNFTSLRQAMGWIDDCSIDYGDHIAIWSRIDFLMRRFPTSLGPILRTVKGTNSQQTPALLVERQVDALAKATAMTPEQFDAAWVAFVKQTYPKR
jgi:hypothetical protein